METTMHIGRKIYEIKEMLEQLKPDIPTEMHSSIEEVKQDLSYISGFVFGHSAQNQKTSCG